jgi:hypothetical protein
MIWNFLVRTRSTVIKDAKANRVPLIEGGTSSGS